MQTYLTSINLKFKQDKYSDNAFSDDPKSKLPSLRAKKNQLC